jgi:hypothetical protein
MVPLVAFVEVQESNALCPWLMVDGLALKLQVGGGGEVVLTVKLTARAALPLPLLVFANDTVAG